MVIGRLKETQADIDVKVRLADATVREIRKYAERYAAEHRRGERESDGQRGVVIAARDRGYEMGIIRKCGSFVRRDMWDSDDCACAIDRYLRKINLMPAR